MRRTIAALLLGLGSLATTSEAADPPLADYFRIEVEKIAARPLLGIESADAWKAARPELQRKFRGMLGLDPWPERTPLRAVVTGTLDRPDFVVEKLVYESSPGLYVTANLYRPKVVDRPLPVVLYLCGHSKVEKDGVILGFKTHYQHHPAWYASNGYVCLILDTLQLGELPGLHHGTSKFGMWWWPARGYTPAGVEAWNAVRGIDYLVSRPEVDPAKIGVTGRSGGGATSWWVGAIDDRVAAVVPVAGITDLKNHVVDGVVEGHCDCMYPVNTERWDFDTVAALVAPKPLLVENTDKDPIFPEDGVRRIYSRLETVYRWYGASDRLGLVIGKGGHVDSPEIRHPSFAFMDKWLKGVDRPIVEPDRSIPAESLAVYWSNRPPADNLNPVIHERFRKAATLPPPPRSAAEWTAMSKALRADLATRVLAGWPTEAEAGPLGLKGTGETVRDAVRIRRRDYQSQPGVRLPLWTLDPADRDIDIKQLRGDSKYLRIIIIDQAAWDAGWGEILGGPKGRTGVGDGSPTWIELRNRVLGGRQVVAIAPRGVGPTAWPADKDKHIRRRFLLLGQTLDGMRAWDVRRGIDAAKSLGTETRHPSPFGDMIRRSRPVVAAQGDSSVWLMLAYAGEQTEADSGLEVEYATARVKPRPKLAVLELTSPPVSIHGGPAFLNLGSTLEMPQLLALLHPRPVLMKQTPSGAWSWTTGIRLSVSWYRPQRKWNTRDFFLYGPTGAPFPEWIDGE